MTGELQGYRHDALIAVDRHGRLTPLLGVELVLGWGRSPHPPLPEHLVDIIHPGRLGELQDLMEPPLDVSGRSLPGTIRLRHADRRWLSMHAEVESHGHNPAIDANVLRFRPVDGPLDPTPPAGHFEELVEVVASGILIADDQGVVEFANPAARELFWRAEHDLLGHRWIESIHHDDQDRVRSAAEHAQLRGTSDIVEFRVPVSGLERWLRARFSALPRAGSRSGWVAMIEDTTVARAGAIELAHQATHDPLTGLANRVLLSDRIAGAVARASRSGLPLALYFCDLDRFKDANDLHGHQVGDQILKEISRRLTNVVRAADTAARLGGDEFVVVAENIDRSDATSLAARIAERLTAPIEVNDVTVELGVSIGVVCTTDPELDGDELLAAADEAMYKAKVAEVGLVVTSVP